MSPIQARAEPLTQILLMRKWGRKGNIIDSGCLNYRQCRETPLGCRKFHLPFSCVTSRGAGRLSSAHPVSQPDEHSSHLENFSAPCQVFLGEMRERLLDKTSSVKTLSSLFFTSAKSPQIFDSDLLSEDICTSAKCCGNTRAEKNGPACWAITQLLISKIRCTTASHLKHAGRVEATSHFQRAEELLFPLTLEGPFYLHTPAASERAMSNAK